VQRFLALFTFLPMGRVRELGQLAGADIRQAKQVLAFEATKILHGEAAARQAEDAARKLFGKGEAGNAVPTTEVGMAELAAGIPAIELFQRAGLCQSRSEVRRLIEQGGAYVNDAPLTDLEAVISAGHLADGQILLRAGKKRYRRIVAR
jgi:tyrosyl-tRNA synthetase